MHVGGFPENSKGQDGAIDFSLIMLFSRLCISILSQIDPRGIFFILSKIISIKLLSIFLSSSFFFFFVCVCFTSPSIRPAVSSPGLPPASMLPFWHRNQSVEY